MYNQDYLNHYGILGMKWGKRKAQIKSYVSKKRVSKENYSEDYKKKLNLKKKSYKELSNAELKELNNRLQLEKQYKDLTKSDKVYGHKIASDILGEIGKDMAKDAIRKGIKSGIKIAIESRRR